ncbi:FMN-binding negative transcriptional regulator [Iodidimonas sp. SYSU 1G8]|uniref:FMN-binding negative transcriptional regulator n=1 Tax=Iodidimonas sp. SYSU 1G8 TaxID=3133967 RepID=UPI0031FEDED0
MYTPDHFREDDGDAALDLIERYRFGLLVAGGDAVHIPFVLDRGQQVLRCHVARDNPVWQDAIGQEVLAVFSGPHAYISPDWYEKAGDVPTWNYLAVHVRGKARQLPEAALEGHLRALIAQEEAHLAPKPVWDLGAVDAVKVTSMQQHIVGMEIPLGRVEAKWKLSQNRTAIDRRKVIGALRARGGEDNTAIADAMEQKEKEVRS